MGQTPEVAKEAEVIETPEVAKEAEVVEKVVKSRRTSRSSKRQAPSVVDENEFSIKKHKTQHLQRIPFSDVSEKDNTSLSNGSSVLSNGEHLTPVEKKILREAEFYFSNSNLSIDKYLKKLSDSDDGWVSIATVASFERMKTFNKKTILSALRKSKEFLEVSADGMNVRRRLPLPKDNLNKSTIYAGQFPHSSTAKSVAEFFEEHMNPEHSICCVRLRRFRKGEKHQGFKGSVFVEFSSEQEAERIVKLNLKTHLNKPMLLMMKNSYINMKNKEFANRKNAKQRKQKLVPKKSQKENRTPRSKRKRQIDTEKPLTNRSLRKSNRSHSKKL